MNKMTPRSGCPVARTLDLVGDKWSLLIVRDILKGKKRYGEFAGSEEAIPTNILADRLRKLGELGIVEKVRYSVHPPRYEYVLSKKGMRLKELIVCLKNWGDENLVADGIGLKA